MRYIKKSLFIAAMVAAFGGATAMAWSRNCHKDCTETKTRTVKVCDNDDCTRSHTETEEVCTKWAEVCDDPPDRHPL